MRVKWQSCGQRVGWGAVGWVGSLRKRCPTAGPCALAMPDSRERGFDDPVDGTKRFGSA